MSLKPINFNEIPERLTMAKSSRDNHDKWLPYWMHACDTAIIIEYLLTNWVSKAEKDSLCEIYETLDNKPVEALMSKHEMHKTGRFLALLHDLGKVTSEFQEKITLNNIDIRTELENDGLMCNKSSNLPHATVSQLLLLSKNINNKKNLFSIACILGAHHGKPTERANAGILPTIDNKWQTIQSLWIDFALKQSEFNNIEDIPQIRMSSQTIWTGLLIMSDWIASNTHYFPLISVDDNGENINYAHRKENAIQRLNLTSVWLPNEEWRYEDLIAKRFSFEPNEIQRITESSVKNIQKPGILILEAPMGSGKTEAALAAAEIIASKTMHSGVFVGLPTQATANGLFNRLKKWTEQQSASEAHSIRLVHGAAYLNEEYQSLMEGCANTENGENDNTSGVIVNQWFSGKKQALLADFVIGTVDQLLMAGLRQRHVMLRHLGLANKIVILDEVHAYDAYMNVYLKTALSWLGAYHVPVIMLSATLPTNKRKDLITAYLNDNKQDAYAWTKNLDYPLITYTDNKQIKQETVELNSDNKKIYISLADQEENNFDLLGKRIQKILKDGGCAGIIVNTVKRAQDCAVAFQKYFTDKEICLIHSQFLMPDRAKNEMKLIKALGKNSQVNQGRPYRLVTIGTQILEQSLDIDFDYMITDLCPMDLLLQRIGRLHRHEGRIRPTNTQKAICKILCSNERAFEPGACAIYGQYMLIRTKKLLEEQTILNIPSDIAKLVQQTYDDNWEPENCGNDYTEAYKEYVYLMNSKESKAKSYALIQPNNSKRNPYIYNLLDVENSSESSITDKTGTAAVRDGDPSIEVIAVKKIKEKIYLINDIDLKCPIDLSEMPSEDVAKEIAKQRLKLPHKFCTNYCIYNTIKELENMSLFDLKEWLFSPWLNGELFLIFDNNCCAYLSGNKLRYSCKNGLEIEKEGKEN